MSNPLRINRASGVKLILNMLPSCIVVNAIYPIKYTKTIWPTDINKFALLYNWETDWIEIIPAVICKKTNSKLFGTIKPSNKTVKTWVNKPSRASKKAYIISGRIQMGTSKT